VGKYELILSTSILFLFGVGSLWLVASLAADEVVVALLAVFSSANRPCVKPSFLSTSKCDEN
jgi:hypothetical protein